MTLGNDLTFSSMKSALKRIFSRSVDQAETSEVKVKEEASLLTEETTLVDSIIKGMLCQGHIIEKR